MSIFDQDFHDASSSFDEWTDFEKVHPAERQMPPRQWEEPEDLYRKLDEY